MTAFEPALPLPPLEPPLSPVSYLGSTAYFKRFKLETDLGDGEEPALPPGLTFVPWSPVLIDAHAEVLCGSFQGEIDSVVFASLADLPGCRNLMLTIVQRSNFVPHATWLLVGEDGPCGSVQGLRERGGIGAVQNLGVVPRRRGCGLGSLLLQQAMAGFRRAGLKRVSLEVTARNERAERLYRRLGFRRVKTVYKPVNVLGY